MRKFYTLLIASGLSMSLLAQQKINLSGRAMLDRYNAERTELAKTNADEAQKSPVTSAFVVLNPGASADDIAAKGIEVTTDLGSVIIVNPPTATTPTTKKKGSTQMCFVRPKSKGDFT